MAYTNKIKDLLDDIYKALFAEFAGAVPVFWGPPDNERAAHWFEVTVLRSENVGDAAFYVARRYTVQIAWLRREEPIVGYVALGNHYEVAARMEGLLDRKQVVDGGWFDGRVGPIDYQYRPADRADNKLTGVLIEWAVTVPESIS